MDHHTTISVIGESVQRERSEERSENLSFWALAGNVIWPAIQKFTLITSLKNLSNVFKNLGDYKKLLDKILKFLETWMY